MSNRNNLKLQERTAHYHLPGLFEFYDMYKIFLELYQTHREYFYDWCDIGSVYGSPTDCLWGGGRVEAGECEPEDVLRLMQEYGISARLTLSNSLLEEKHLSDRRCNELCKLFATKKEMEENAGNEAIVQSEKNPQDGIIVHSDLLLSYLRKKYPNFYYVSSTTKVLTEFDDFLKEINREDFRYVVPDFRLNKELEKLSQLTEQQKDKVEFLCNECCSFDCMDRRACYEDVSRKNLGEAGTEHRCKSKNAAEGYRFSLAMKNPGFISLEDIQNIYLPMGFSNFKIEGRGLGSAVVLEMLMYYMVKPEFQLLVREAVYLDSMLDLF